MWHAHYFWSARNCVNWYSVASGTYLPQGAPCSGSVPTGMATLPVCIPRGYCVSCSYCVCSSWSVSYSCFVCSSYYTCDSCYMPCSCCTPCPVLVAYLRHPCSSNIPGHGLHTLHIGRVPGWGHHWDQPVEGSWLICIVLHQAGRTTTWPLFGRRVVGTGGPSL